MRAPMGDYGTGLGGATAAAQVGLQSAFERNRDLIAILVLWHRLENTPHVQGYPKECPSCLEYVTSTQYDWGSDSPLYEDGSCSNGAGETRERAMLANLYGAIVMKMEQPYQAALKLLAKNRAEGTNRWVGPHMPSDEIERACIVSEALWMLGDRV